MEIAELAVKVQQLEAEQRRNSDAHEKIYERLGKLENQYARTDERYKKIEEALDDQKSQLENIQRALDELSKKPGKRWDSAVGAAMSAGIGGIVGFFLNALTR